jgi:hypothetical protein
MSNENSKNKAVRFNLDASNDKLLFDAIDESGLNFSGETKKMWANKLKVEYKCRKSGPNNTKESK